MTPSPITGGITNRNFVAEDTTGKYFVRLGEDIALHQIMRFNELAASKAAHAAGISPRVHFSQPGAMVLDFVEGKTLNAEDVRDEQRLVRILDLIKRCHRDVPRHWRGPALVFWVFQVVRDYAATLVEDNSRYAAETTTFLRIADELERCVGDIELVFGHNDLLPANFLDDGERLWLIDYDYAGFNSPLFDLGGLASNNELDSSQEAMMLEHYFQRAPDEGLWRAYQAMKCASLLRESMWSMVSELHSDLDVDYVAYTNENLTRFEVTLSAFHELPR